MKQLPIAGTEPPRDQDVEDAIDEYNLAKEEHRRATERLRVTGSIVVQRLLAREMASYDYVDGSGKQWAAELKLPEQPTVSVKFIGVRDE